MKRDVHLLSAELARLVMLPKLVGSNRVGEHVRELAVDAHSFLAAEYSDFGLEKKKAGSKPVINSISVLFPAMDFIEVVALDRNAFLKCVTTLHTLSSF